MNTIRAIDLAISKYRLPYEKQKYKGFLITNYCPVRIKKITNLETRQITAFYIFEHVGHKQELKH